MEYLYHVVYVYLSLPLACDQLKGGFHLLTFPLPALPPLGHRDLGPQSRELALKVLRSSGYGDSEYGTERSISGCVLSRAWSWVWLTMLHFPQLNSWARPHCPWAPLPDRCPEDRCAHSPLHQGKLWDPQPPWQWR